MTLLERRDSPAAKPVINQEDLDSGPSIHIWKLQFACLTLVPGVPTSPSELCRWMQACSSLTRRADKNLWRVINWCTSDTKITKLIFSWQLFCKKRLRGWKRWSSVKRLPDEHMPVFWSTRGPLLERPATQREHSTEWMRPPPQWNPGEVNSKNVGMFLNYLNHSCLYLHSRQLYANKHRTMRRMLYWEREGQSILFYH